MWFLVLAFELNNAMCGLHKGEQVDVIRRAWIIRVSQSAGVCTLPLNMNDVPLV